MTWGDGPELAAAAWTLGVPHPTGYPLYMLSLHAFQWLPAGTAAFRSHLYSAVCVAAALALLFNLLQRRLAPLTSPRASRWAAFGACAAAGLNPLIWPAATQVEVYGLFMLLFVLTLDLIDRTLCDPSKYMHWLALAAGLHLVHHRLAVFILIAAAGVVIARMAKPQCPCWGDAGPAPERRSIISAIPWLLAPLALLLYFPIRAMSDPLINWYDPDSLGRLWALVRGELYQGIIGNGIQLWTQDFQLSRFIFLFTLPWLSYSILFLFAAAGLYFAIQKTPWLGWLSLYLIVVHTLFVMVYPVGDWPVFFLPAAVAMAVPLGYGLAFTLNAIQKTELKTSISWLVHAAILASLTLPLFVKWDEEKGLRQGAASLNPFPISWQSGATRFSHAPGWEPYRYAERVWRATPYGAPIVSGLFEPTADNELYPLLYQKAVEQRGEHSVLIGTGFLFLDWYREQIDSRIALGLEPRGGQRSLTRNDWLEDTWETVVHPLLLRGPVVTTSYPAPPEWSGRARMRLIQPEPVDRRNAPLSYQPMIPRGMITEMRLPEDDE